jgi:hypothetical protein
VRVLVGQLHGFVLLGAVHDGLLLGQLRAHVPALRQLHAGLLERPLLDLLRGRHMRGRLLVGPLQHLVSERRHVHRRVLWRRMRTRVRAGLDVLLLGLLWRRVLLHRAGLSLSARRHCPQPPELHGTQVPFWHTTLPAVQLPLQQGCPLPPQLPQLPDLQSPPMSGHVEPEATQKSSAQHPPPLHVPAAQQ